MQLVLHLGKESLGGRGILVLVDAGGVDVGNFLIKPTFTEPDLPDLFRQTLKVILPKEGAVLHALLIQHIALDGKLPQNLGGPLAELGGPNRIDPVTHRYDGVQIIELNIPGNFTFALSLNYPEFPNSCPTTNLTLFINIFQMLIYGANIHIKKLCHQLFGQPNGLILIPDFDTLFPACPVKIRNSAELLRISCFPFLLSCFMVHPHISKFNLIFLQDHFLALYFDQKLRLRPWA